MFHHAQALASRGLCVAVHNFANNYSPGLVCFREDGSHYWENNTQEEQLLRASTVEGKTFLPLSMYPISPAGKIAGLVTPSVWFHTGYTADVVTCAAILSPLLNGADYAPGVEDEVVKHMVLVLTMAKDADVFITGLWGCGAFSHPVKASLRAWRRALQCTATPPRFVHFCYMKDGLTMIMSPDEETVDVMDVLTL